MSATTSRFEGLRSERELVKVAADRLSIRWYLGYDLDEALPDHSSLSRIRTRLGLEVFQRFFEQIVELCQAAGLVWGRELLFDATKVRANADLDSLVPRFYWQAKQHLVELFDEANAPSTTNGDATPPRPAPPPDVDSEPRRLPTGLSPEEEGRFAAERAETLAAAQRAAAGSQPSSRPGVSAPDRPARQPN